MNTNASDRYKILLNIVANVGINGDVHGEYARTMASLHGMDSYNALQAQMPQPAPQGDMTGGEQMPAQSPMNNQEATPNPMTEGQGSLILPQ